MSFDVDEDILQDFLIEAGEILELLQEQLVELENNPDDSELLNAIFRGFHTIKGGAGFMSLKELVDVCHGAENIFDLLRTGQRTVNAELMDVILEGLDAINEMFTLVKAREPLEPAEAKLLEELAKLSVPEGEEVVAAQLELEPEANVAGNDEMSDAEFDALLDELNAGKSAPVVQASPSVSAASDSDEMSDDEFEALLDDLHNAKKNAATVKSAPVPNSDEITDDEFDAFLDQLHSKGKTASSVETTVSKVNEPPVIKSNSQEIDDAEFEALLDELHGAKKE